MKAPVLLFGALSAALLVGMIVTLSRSPLFPFQTDNKQWLQDWLAFSVRPCVVACSCCAEQAHGTGKCLPVSGKCRYALLWACKCGVTHSPVALDDMHALQVADFYGVAIPFAAIIIATEGLARGAGWAVGTCLLGSPVACGYLAWKLTSGSIALRGFDGYAYTQ